MNREQKSAAIAEIASQIDEADAIFAVDYRGISVSEAAELRARLRDADATFKVVKNSLTERAADQSGTPELKEYLTGPTALTFVRGDAAVAAKAVADFARATQLLPFKGGLMDGEQLDVEQIRALSRLPSREVLYGQLVGVVASPVSGLVRSLAALLGGLASALGQVRDKKESGEIPAGDAPAPAEAEAAPEGDAEPEAPAEPDGDGEAAPDAEGETPAEADAEAGAAAEAPVDAEADAEAEAEAEPEAEAEVEAESDAAEGDKAEPANGSAPQAGADASQQTDDNQADVSAEDQPEDAETNPKED